MRPKIKLVIPDCLPIGAHCIVEFVHYLSGADQWGGFDTALELVASVEDESISWVLFFYDFDESSHVHQSSSCVVLLCVLPLHLSGQGRAVDVVQGDDSHSGELRVEGDDEQ